MNQLHDINTEMAILGAVLLEKNAYLTASDTLVGSDFYDEKNGLIFDACGELFAVNSPIDMLTVSTQLRKAGRLTAAGGSFYLTQCADKVASAANLKYHTATIKELSIRRNLVTKLTRLNQQAGQITIDLDSILESTSTLIDDVLQNVANKAQILALKDNVAQYIDKVANDQKNIGHSDKKRLSPSIVSLAELIPEWAPGELIIIAGRPGMGKCLGRGTKVLMYDGSLKNVEDVQPGDILMGPDSTPRNVKTICTGREMMYFVKQNKGIDYRVNESHILSLKRSRNEGSQKNGDVINISVRDYLNKSNKFKSNYKGYKVGVEFSENELVLNPYYLGLWLGDGNSRDQRITNVDDEVISWLRDYANDIGGRFKKGKTMNRCSNYAIRDSDNSLLKVGHQLKKLDLIKDKHIPINYLINSRSNRLLLLAGIIDTDGYYCENSNCFEITQKNEHLAKQIKFLCDTLGFKTSLTEKKASIKSIGFECNVYRVRISGDIETIPTKVERRKARSRKAKTDWRNTGIEVIPDKVDDYFGFEIDGDRLFLLEDCTVTHNTALAINEACELAYQGYPSYFASLEMTARELAGRVVQRESGLTRYDFERRMTPEQLAKIDDAARFLADKKIFIDDTPLASLNHIKIKAKLLKQTQGIRAVFIDYLQLITPADKKQIREQQVAEITKQLKAIAKELQLPVFLLAQLNREVENRPGKRPQMSDLRESGAIEQDADIIIFPVRPEHYDKEDPALKGKVIFIVAKNRGGATGEVMAHCNESVTRFSDEVSVNYDYYNNLTPF